MKADALGARMRAFESAHDLCVLPGLWMVARMDGRGFTRLVRELHPFEAPFDPLFRDHMIATATHVMDCGFGTVLACTQSDELSILLRRDEAAFGRRLSKLLSVFAGEASAQFSARLGAPAAFDCRISQLPRSEDVVDYFRWRQEDAARNALNAHCYWALRKQGESGTAATARLRGLSGAAKHDLLFQHGINFNGLPAWQKRGVGLCWQQHVRAGRNPLTGAVTETLRRELQVEMELPLKEQMGDWVRQLLDDDLEAVG